MENTLSEKAFFSTLYKTGLPGPPCLCLISPQDTYHGIYLLAVSPLCVSLTRMVVPWGRDFGYLVQSYIPRTLHLVGAQ